MNVPCLHRTLLIGRTVSWYGFPTTCKKSLEYSLKFQKLPLTTSRRSVSSKLTVQSMEQIYAGPMSRRILAIKLLTMATTLTTIPIQIYVLYTNEEARKSTAAMVAIITCVAFQTIMPFLIHLVTKRYVLKMYHNPTTDKYAIETYGLLPIKKYITFRPSESRPPKVEVFATAVIREKYPIFFDPKFFTDVHHYKRLLGYDKPITFSDGENVEETPEKTREAKNREEPS